MKYLLDTCLVSELIKPRPDPAVTAWVSAQQESNLYLSVLTIGELRCGVERLQDGRKRRRLTNWLASDLKPRFSGRVLPIDDEVVERWGIVTAHAQAKGAPMPVIDGLIAATALVHGLTLITRNVSDMLPSGVLLFNPWASDRRCE